EEAEQAARHALGLMDGTTELTLLSSFAQALVILCERMGPEAAAPVSARGAQRFLAILARPLLPTAVGSPAQALGQLAGRLGPEEAARAAQAVFDLLTRVSDQVAQFYLAQALANLAARLGPDEAARLTLPVLELMSRTALPNVLSALEEAAAKL